MHRLGWRIIGVSVLLTDEVFLHVRVATAQLTENGRESQCQSSCSNQCTSAVPAPLIGHSGPTQHWLQREACGGWGVQQQGPQRARWGRWRVRQCSSIGGSKCGVVGANHRRVSHRTNDGTPISELSRKGVGASKKYVEFRKQLLRHFYH